MLTSIARAGSRAWAVGMTAAGPEAPRAPIALAYQGGTWRKMPIARQSGEHALFGIDRSTSGRLWAVGYRQTSSGYRPLLLSWVSGRWVPRSLGAVGQHGGTLVDVRARSDGATFAVGYSVDGVGQHPLMVRRTEHGWRRDRLPIASAGTGALLAVDAVSASDAWAVGWRTVKGTPQPWVVHWDGSRWRSVAAVRSGSEGVLTSVAIGPAGTVWAAGYRIAGGRYRPIVQRFDGRAWRTDAFPAGGMSVGVLRGIAVQADGSPVVAGTRWDEDAARWRAFVAWLGGSGWQVDDVAGSGSTDLHGVALGPDGTAWAVGGSGTRSLIATACDGATAASGEALGRVALRAVASGAPPGSPEPEATIPATTETPSPTEAPTRAATPSPATRATEDGTSTTTAAQARVRARDVTKAAGLAGSIHSYGAVRADFDGDGWPDLFIGRHSEPGRLLLNDRGTFAAAPGVRFPDRDRHGCAAADVNDDGRLDLYCAIGASKGVALKANELWVAQPDGTYEDQATELLASDPIGRGRLVAFFDLDHDAYPDLFLADRPDRPDGLPSRHRVLANPGGDGFVARSAAGFDAGSGADCVLTGDLDRDGWEDVVLCTRGYRPGGYGIRILRNVRGRLVDATSTAHIARARTVDATLADVDGDRRPDIIEVTRSQLRVHLRRGSRYVLAYTRRLVDGAAVAAGDADGDGDLDLYVAQGSTTVQRPDLLLLNGGDGRGYRRLALPGVTTGAAESVTAIDHDRNGLADFLVLNGARSTHVGPTQLIGLYPR
ncbi:MAG: FG-GAP-like repeat-containing protein [Chloroflexota bacterium]